MALSLLKSGSGVHVTGLPLNETKVIPSSKLGVSRVCQIFVSSHNKQLRSKLYPVLSLDLKENPNFVPDRTGSGDLSIKTPASFPLHFQTQTSTGLSRAVRWWEKTLKPNMLEIHSARQLVNSLMNAGDKLVIVDFYSPGCGGCRALHPKICQLAESNPNVMFLKVNHEELRTMCHSLHIHVLPFFRFYRGAEGRLCSFSCTNATIKKFKNALLKHGTERCSIGPTKGLDEKELTALASAGELPLNLPISTKKMIMEDLFMQSTNYSCFLDKIGDQMEIKSESTMFYGS